MDSVEVNMTENYVDSQPQPTKTAPANAAKEAPTAALTEAAV